MKRKMFSSILSVLLVSVCLLAAPVAFADTLPSPDGKNPSIGEKALKGFTNTVGGWTEIVQSPAEEIKEKGPLGMISGLLYCIVKIPYRTVGGAIQLLTSPIPGSGLIDDHPMEALSK